MVVVTILHTNLRKGGTMVQIITTSITSTGASMLPGNSTSSSMLLGNNNRHSKQQLLQALLHHPLLINLRKVIQIVCLKDP